MLPGVNRRWPWLHEKYQDKLNREIWVRAAMKRDRVEMLLVAAMILALIGQTVCAIVMIRQSLPL